MSEVGARLKKAADTSQKTLNEKKLTVSRVLVYSSVPAHYLHHWIAYRKHMKTGSGFVPAGYLHTDIIFTIADNLYDGVT